MNIRELLEQQTERYTDKIFLYYKDEKITFQDFNVAVNKISNGLKQIGVAKGDMTAIMIPNSPVFLYSWMGINKIGAVEVPINLALKEDEVKYILQHSEASCLIIHQDYYPVFNRIKGEGLPKLKNIIFYGEEARPSGIIPFSQLLDEKADLEDVDISDNDPAVCIYTSGTTDRPKGVINSHKSWVLTGQAYAYTVGITPDDRVMTSNPLFHANAQAYPTMGSLAAGASLILLERFCSAWIIEQTRKYQAT